MSPQLSHLPAVWVVIAPSSLSYLFNQIDNTFLLWLLSVEIGLSLIQEISFIHRTKMCSTHYTLGTGIMIKEQFLPRGALQELQEVAPYYFLLTLNSFLHPSLFWHLNGQKSMPEKNENRAKGVLDIPKPLYVKFISFF